MFLALCPEWKVSDYVFEYGVIPPIPFGAQRIPDVFMNNKENKAPLSWRVPEFIGCQPASRRSDYAVCCL